MMSRARMPGMRRIAPGVEGTPGPTVRLAGDGRSQPAEVQGLTLLPM